MKIFERKQQKLTKHSRSYAAKIFASLQPEMAVFETTIMQESGR